MEWNWGNDGTYWIYFLFTLTRWKYLGADTVRLSDERERERESERERTRERL